MSDKIYQEFLKGFKFEVDNRIFALRAIARIANRTRGTPEGVFWDCYLRLEHHSELYYIKMARKWGIDPTPKILVRLKSFVIGNTPKILLNSLLAYVHPKTIFYLSKLKKVRDIGPDLECDFLNYMVAQEVTQIEMMRLALVGDYSYIPIYLDEFIKSSSLKI